MKTKNSLITNSIWPLIHRLSALPYFTTNTLILIATPVSARILYNTPQHGLPLSITNFLDGPIGPIPLNLSRLYFASVAFFIVQLVVRCFDAYFGAGAKSFKLWKESQMGIQYVVSVTRHNPNLGTAELEQRLAERYEKISSIYLRSLPVLQYTSISLLLIGAYLSSLAAISQIKYVLLQTDFAALIDPRNF